MTEQEEIRLVKLIQQYSAVVIDKSNPLYGRTLITDVFALANVIDNYYKKRFKNEN